MEENKLQNLNRKKPVFTVKNIMRILTLFCVIFFFCPSFFVSCSGQKLNVSAVTVIGGVSLYGEKISDPYPVMLICLIIPVIVLVLLFLKKFTDKKTALITLLCMAADFVIWLVFRSAVKKAAEDNYCTFKVTGWYAMNLVFLLVLIFLSAFAALKKVELEMDLRVFFSSGGTQDAISHMSENVSRMADSVTGLTDTLLSNIKKKTPKEDEKDEKKPKFCFHCGAKLGEGASFCSNCGTRIK